MIILKITLKKKKTEKIVQTKFTGFCMIKPTKTLTLLPLIPK